ncbi:MAG: polyamine ABC transporter ATP-binding protein [Desulfuromonas sp.]|nr:MAG: polyamine ABC transporter ATP-binding protein [Desulfuromonas sp.]
MASKHFEIEVRDLTMMYDDTVIQRGLDFAIEAGEVFVIMGGSGCGKSTLLRHLIGLQSPAAGTILYRGVDFWDGSRQMRQEILRRCGILYQGGALWSSMSLAENVALPLQEFTSLTAGQIDELVHLKLSLVGLAEFSGYYPAEISGGMRKRAGLARAMALDPDVLFFDEPSAGLDPVSARQLDDLILELKGGLGTTIVIVTHELASIFAVADRALFLDRESKTQLALGPPQQLLETSREEHVVRFLSRGQEPS